MPLVISKLARVRSQGDTKWSKLILLTNFNSDLVPVLTLWLLAKVSDNNETSCHPHKPTEPLRLAQEILWLRLAPAVHHQKFLPRCMSRGCHANCCGMHPLLKAQSRAHHRQFLPQGATV